MPLTKTIGERLSETRKSKGLTRKQMAEFLNVDTETYARYERGTNEPRSSTVAHMAAMLGVSAGYLVGIEDESSHPGDDAYQRLPDTPVVRTPVLRRARVAELWSEGKLDSSLKYSAETYIAVDAVMLSLGRPRRNYRGIFAITTEYEDGEIDRLESDGIFNKTLVVIDQEKPVEQGGLALVTLAGQIVLKHVHVSPSGVVVLRNSDGSVILTPEDQQKAGYGVIGTPALILTPAVPAWSI